MAPAHPYLGGYCLEYSPEARSGESESPISDAYSLPLDEGRVDMMST